MSSDRNPENFYENNIFNSVETAELAEDLECSSVNLISGIQGKFYINLLTPTQKTDKLKSRQLGTESTVTNYLMLNIPGYLVMPFANLSIETLYSQGKVINESNGDPINVLTVKDQSFTIPKGTKFLFCFFGGQLEYHRIKIIGIY